MNIKFETRTRNVASGMFVFLTVFLAYSQTITFDWVNWDDGEYVLRNPIIGLPPLEALARMFGSGYYLSYTPIALASHALDLRLWGPAPAGHHLTNVLLHSLNAVWVAMLALVILQGFNRGRRERKALLADATTMELTASFLAALLFALHPMRAESVAWIADRKDLLSAALVLPAAILYLRGRFANRFRFISPLSCLSLALFALGVLAKTASIALSGVLLLVEWFVVGREAGWRERLRNTLHTLPYFLISLGAGAAAMRAAPPSVALRLGVESLSPPLLLALPGYTFLFYIWKIVYPVPLLPIYVAPPPVIVLCAVACVVILACALFVFYRKGNVGLSTAVLAYVILLIPTIVGLKSSIMPWADRYSYLPTIPLFLLAGYGVSRLVKTAGNDNGPLLRRVVGVFTGAILVSLVVLTVLQCQTWRDGLALWNHQLRHGERDIVALNNLGTAYLSVGHNLEAKELFEEAVRREPRFEMALLNLRYVTTGEDDLLRLMDKYKHVLQQDPSDSHLRVALGELYGSQGLQDSAVAEFRRAVESNPDCGEGWCDLGQWHLRRGREDSARICLQRAIQKVPGYSHPYYLLGMVALTHSDTAAAVQQLTTAARLGEAEARKALRVLNKTW